MDFYFFGILIEYAYLILMIGNIYFIFVKNCLEIHILLKQNILVDNTFIS